MTTAAAPENPKSPLLVARPHVDLCRRVRTDGCAAHLPAARRDLRRPDLRHPLGVTVRLLIAFVPVVGSAATAGLTGAT